MQSNFVSNQLSNRTPADSMLYGHRLSFVLEYYWTIDHEVGVEISMTNQKL